MALLRTISTRVRSFRAIQSAVVHHGRRVARKLDERYNPRLPEHLKIDFQRLLQAILELFRQSCDRLVSAEHHLVGGRGNDKMKRQQRDADAGRLRAAILGFRDAFKGIYRPLDVEEFGFPRVVGRLTFDLLRQGDLLLEILGRPGLVVPEPHFSDGLDLAHELAKIEELVAALRRSVDEVDAELKLAQAAKVDKDEAQESWDFLLLWGGRIVTGLFFLAGEAELARFILPSTRRAGRTRQIARQERLEEAGATPSASHGAPGGKEPGPVLGGEVASDRVPAETPPAECSSGPSLEGRAETPRLSTRSGQAREPAHTKSADSSGKRRGRPPCLPSRPDRTGSPAAPPVCRRPLIRPPPSAGVEVRP